MIADIMIGEVLKYLHVYDKKIKLVEFVYIPPSGTKVIYSVKFAGTHINSITKTFIRADGGKTQYKCVKEDKNWKPKFLQ